MKTVTLLLDKLIAYAGNPRKNDHAVEAVAAAIKRFGFRVPVLAKSDGSLIDGHLRVKAAKHLGMKDVPVVLCDDLSEADIKALRISMNRMAELAEWDTELLSAELEGLASEGITLEDVGFDSSALDALGVSANEDVEIKNGPQEFGVNITFSIVFENPQQQQAWYDLVKVWKRRFGNDAPLGQLIEMESNAQNNATLD
jgi:ParB-like chromosome segregation protein Spo0J